MMVRRLFSAPRCFSLMAIALLSFGTASLLTGCGSGGDTERPLQGRAAVRIVRTLTGVSGGTGGIAVTTSRSPLLDASNLQLGETTGYEAISPGRFTITVTAADNAGGTPILKQSRISSIEIARRYTVFVAGDAASAATTLTQPNTLITRDDFPMLTDQQSAVRVVHQAIGLPAIDLYTTAVPPAPATPSATPTPSTTPSPSPSPTPFAVPLIGAANIGYGNASAYQVVNSGYVQFTVRNHATAESVATRSLQRGPQLYLAPGRSYTLLVLGKSSSDPNSSEAVDALLLPDDDRTNATKDADATPSPAPTTTPDED